jgi:hypothetical protein
MAKPKAMSEDELRALTDSEMRQAVGFYGGKLAEQRRKAEYYYLGLPKGDLTPPEVEGRSQVVSPDVRNTIEAMLPQLMVKFTGGDTVVEFEAQKPTDEEKAKQVTDYLNYLFFKKNNGHNVTYTMFKDALLQKRGIAKVWWDNRVEETKEEYRALSDVELAEILDDKEVEPVSHDTYVDEDDLKQRQQAIEQLNQQMQPALQAAQTNPQAMQAVQQLQAQIAHIESLPPVMLHNIEVSRKKTSGKITIENVPPEEFLISRKAKNIETASFIGHRVARTMSELRSMGYKNIDNISSDDGAAAFNAERVERLSWDDEQAYLNIENISTDESQRQVWVTECYVRCDYDGDGLSELRKVTRAGNQILDNEIVDIVPFVSVCPVPLPHKFFGLSIADLAFESQLTKTSILRAQLDNMYLQVNGRYFAVDGQVNIDDLLTSRPGGVVRMKQAGMAGRLDQGQMDGSGQMMMEYMEGFLESSTGWTRQSQGNSAGNLQGTATGMNIITNKDDMRLDLIARNFAEGFCDMFKLMLKLVCQHQQQPAEIKLNGTWLNIDPREWRNQFDVSINVGLGVGNKDQRVAHLMALRQQQDIGMQFGVATPENVYNANKELSKELGFKNGDKFFTDPAKNPPPQHPDPEQMKAQAQLPLIQAKAQADAQLKQMELQAQGQHKQIDAQASMQVERDKMTMQAQVDQHRQQVEAEQQAAKMEKEAQLAQFNAQLDAQKEQMRLQHERELKMLDIEAQERKAQFEGSVKIQVAQISAQNALDTASLAAQNAAANEVSSELDNTEVMDAITQLASSVGEIHKHISAPKKIVRGPDGKAIGVDIGGVVKTINRSADGRMEGI